MFKRLSSLAAVVMTLTLSTTVSAAALDPVQGSDLPTTFMQSDGLGCC